MKYLLFTDLHLDDKLSLIMLQGDRISDGIKILDDLINVVSGNDLDGIIHLGDITEKKDRIPATIVNPFMERIINLNNYKYYNFWLRGNHDSQVKDSPFFQFINNLKYTKFITETCDFEEFYWIPFGNTFEQPSKNKICLVHDEIEGVTYSGSPVYTTMDFKIKDFESFDYVFSGHIHSAQKLQGGRVNYIGSPYDTDFLENNLTTKRYYVILDTDNLAVEWIEIHGNPRMFIITDDFTKKEEFFNKNKDLVKGNYIKLRKELNIEERNLINNQEIRQLMESMQVKGYTTEFNSKIVNKTATEINKNNSYDDAIIMKQVIQENNKNLNEEQLYFIMMQLFNEC